jgi:hypothetical protein
LALGREGTFQMREFRENITSVLFIDLLPYWLSHSNLQCCRGPQKGCRVCNHDAYYELKAIGRQKDIIPSHYLISRTEIYKFVFLLRKHKL